MRIAAAAYDRSANLRKLRKLHRLVVPRAVQAAIARGVSIQGLRPLPVRLAAALHRTIATAEASPSIEVFSRRILDSARLEDLEIASAAFALAEAVCTSPAGVEASDPPSIDPTRCLPGEAARVLRWFATVSQGPRHTPPPPNKKVAVALRSA